MTSRDLEIADLPHDEPWLRLPGESTKAYGWFCRYRDMPAAERSMAALAKRHSRSSATFKVWAHQWKWTTRVDAWDEHLALVERDAQIEGVRQAGVKRVALVVDGLELIHARLVGRDGVVDDVTGEVVREPVQAIRPDLLDARELAALGNMLSKMHAAADEASGVKPLAEQQVRVELAFNLDTADDPPGHRVLEARIVSPEGTRGEIPPAEPEPDE